MFAVLAPEHLEPGSPKALAVAANAAVAMNVSAEFLAPHIWNLYQGGRQEGAVPCLHGVVYSNYCDNACMDDPDGEACKGECRCPPPVPPVPKQRGAPMVQRAGLPAGQGGNWPRIFLLGAQKAATTSLARLFETVGLCPSSQGKECHVLVKVGKETPPESAGAVVPTYTSEFSDIDSSRTGKTNCSVQGHYDGNPFLLTDRGAPVFLRTFMPHDLQAKVRLVAILREPAQRMLSWHNQRSPNKDPRVFAARTQTEIDAWVKNDVLENAHTGVQNFWDAENGDGQWVHSPPLDMMIGMYEHSVHGPMGWTKHWPRGQLFIINYDHFAADAASVLGPLGKFMGVDLLSEPMPRENVHSEAENVCKAMCCETLCALQHVAFADSNRRLYQCMDADSAAHAGPAGELPFGRFKAPECVACDAATTAEEIRASCTASD
jgi:hypothetical protein